MSLLLQFVEENIYVPFKPDREICFLYNNFPRYPKIALFEYMIKTYIISKYKMFWNNCNQ